MSLPTRAATECPASFLTRAGMTARPNGPAPNIRAQFARIEIVESIAVVHLKAQHWSGKLAGADARASDVFTLLKWNGEWKITHKLFHWHDQQL